MKKRLLFVLASFVILIGCVNPATLLPPQIAPATSLPPAVQNLATPIPITVSFDPAELSAMESMLVSLYANTNPGVVSIQTYSNVGSGKAPALSSMQRDM